MSNNQVGDEGAETLAYHAALTTLNLAQNDISALGAKHFLWNQTLHMLDLRYNAIDPIMEKLISKLSKLNPLQRFQYLHQTRRDYDQKQKALQQNSPASQADLNAVLQVITILDALLLDLPKRSPFSLRTLSLFSLQKHIASLPETAQADFIASHLPNSLQSGYQAMVKDSAYRCFC